ncbi:MAG: hypothetical protein IJE08_00280 [Clostridia bacterium]|nr:hypothetical protein [Clostridia bacterium]
MKPQKNNILWIVLAVAIVVFAVYSFLTDSLEHIEDTNGADNYALTTITDENIINQDIGALNVRKSRGLLNDGITFSSDKFTGVYRIFSTTFLFNSDFQMDLAGFYVNSGNFEMAIVSNGQIIATVEPGMFAEVSLTGLNGDFELVIAGESADFEFTLDRFFCDAYGITIE